MSDDHKEPNYMGVFYLLTILTALEIGVTFVPISKLVIGILLVGMALAKALLVAMYFMHLKFEKSTLGIIALTPLILCTLLIFALLALLTALEVAVTYIPGLPLAPILLTMSFAKALLVILYFMHLRFDNRWFSFIFFAPFLLVIPFLIVLRL